MLRCSRINRVGGRGHLTPTRPKYTDRPGVWGPQSQKEGDTLARRWEFYRFVLSQKFGKLTAPFRSKKAVWTFRVWQTRVWKTTTLCLIAFSFLLMGNIWCLLLYHAYSVGASTPVLERKVREHRISKQILGMVREREKDLTIINEQDAAKAVLASRKAA